MPKNGDEFYYPGGLYFEGGNESNERTDVYLEISGPSENTPRTLILRFVTGSGEFSLVGTMPEQLVKVADWIAKTIREEILPPRKE